MFTLGKINRECYHVNNHFISYSRIIQERKSVNSACCVNRFREGKMSDKRVRIMSFRLNGEVYRWLQRLAANQKMTMSEVVFSVLEESMADTEKTNRQIQKIYSEVIEIKGMLKQSQTEENKK